MTRKSCTTTLNLNHKHVTKMIIAFHSVSLVNELMNIKCIIKLLIK